MPLRAPSSSFQTIDRNLMKREGKAGRCLFCSEPLNNWSTVVHVWWCISDDTVFLPEEVAQAKIDRPGIELELWPLGSGCARKLPKEYIVK